jgi:drug/metabolite transporter (DMT)-like permease
VSADAARPRLFGLVAVGIAIVAFSLASPIIKWSESTGSVIAFWRMIGAVITWWFLLTIERLRVGRHFPTASTWRAVLVPALFFGANIAVFFTAITRTSIAHAEFIATLSPLLLVPAGALLFGEHPNWRALRWGTLSIGGVALVIFFEPAQGAATLGGDLLMILVVILWTCYLLTSKRARLSGVNTFDFMACLMPLGLLTAGPIALVISGSEIFELSARGWFVVAVLTLMTGMLAHGCIIFAQRFIPVATIGIMQSGQPALAVFWGFLILGEVVQAPQILGMSFVVMGIGMFTWSSQRGAPEH